MYGEKVTGASGFYQHASYGDGGWGQLAVGQGVVAMEK